MFQSLALLSVFEIYTFKLAMFMYKYVHNQVADCVNELFTRTYEIHNRVTRHSDKFYIPFSRLSTVCKSVRFKGPLVWNSICDDVDVFCCIGTFKSYLKKYLNSCTISFTMSDFIVCHRMSNGLHNCTFVPPLSMKLLYAYSYRTHTPAGVQSPLPWKWIVGK